MGRDAFEPVNLPVEGRGGADPAEIAQTLFGAQEPVEGNYTETVESIGTDPDEPVLLVTRLGLPDDSGLGMRYRLEFAPQNDQWELVWGKQQVTCRPDHGH